MEKLAVRRRGDRLVNSVKRRRTPYFQRQSFDRRTFSATLNGLLSALSSNLTSLFEAWEWKIGDTASL